MFIPSQMYGGAGVDHRLPIACFLLMIASSAPRFPSRRVATAVASVAGSMLVIRLVVIEHVWRQADEIYSADLIGIDALPRGIKLAVAIPPDGIHRAAGGQGRAAFAGDHGEEGKRIYGDTIPAHAADKRIVVTKEPIGVTAAINFLPVSHGLSVFDKSVDQQVLKLRDPELGSV